MILRHLYRANPGLLLVAPLFVSLLVFGCSATSHPTLYQIKRQIAATPAIGWHQLEMSYAGGTVTLVGDVADPEDRIRIEKIAKSVPGIRRVDNQIKLIERNHLPSTKLAQAIEARLLAAPIRNYAVKVKTQVGAVTLTGEAASEVDRLRIEEIARQAPGVRSIDNQISVRQPKTDTEITQEIRRRLLTSDIESTPYLQVTVRNRLAIVSGDCASRRRWIVF